MEEEGKIAVRSYNIGTMSFIRKLCGLNYVVLLATYVFPSLRSYIVVALVSVGGGVGHAMGAKS